MTHGKRNDPVKKPTQRARLLPANGNTCDQIVLKHSLNPSPTKDIILVTFLSFGLIIMAKKYALISPLWPRYPKFLFIIPVCVYMKNEQTTGVCKQR